MPATKNGADSPMRSLYQRLEAVGYKKNYIQKVVLPSWWDDAEADASPTTQMQAILLLSRRLGLPADALIGDGPLVPDVAQSVCYKRHLDAQDEKTAVAASVAVQAARLTARAVSDAVAPYTPLPTSVAELRQQMLAAFATRAPAESVGGAVTLPQLVEWCWKHGIPVVHLGNLPTHKPQALVVQTPTRPVIALCENRTSPAWQAFLLAHEMRHIACGHIDESGVLLDTRLNMETTDAKEKEANGGACELLTGERNACYKIKQAVSAATVAASARSFGRQKQIDPGVVILNAFYHQPKYHSLFMKALPMVEPNADAVALVCRAALNRLDLSRLRDDDAEFLGNLIGVPAATALVSADAV